MATTEPSLTSPLLRAIRQRMASLDSADLLRLWVENDRGQYSDEAFEAARSVLAERGVELPPQNDPPPMAERAPAVPRDPEAVRRDPSAAFWVSWLRPVLWVGAVVGASRIVGSVFFLWAMAEETFAGVGFADAARQMAFGAAGYGSLLNLLVASLLLIGVWLAMWLRPLGRRLLLAYAWVVVALAALQALGTIWLAAANRSSMTLWSLSHLGDIAHAAAYPLVLIVFLRRTEIRQLFEPTHPAFEVHRVSVESAA